MYKYAIFDIKPAYIHYIFHHRCPVTLTENFIWGHIHLTMGMGFISGALFPGSQPISWLVYTA